jgi:SulP family sulfate permease
VHKLLRYIEKAVQAARAYNTLDLFPFPGTISSYRRSNLPGDLRASINVALLAFPQGMAYAMIAGLPIQYGIYGSAIAAIVGPLFTKSRFITLGPTNATAVILLSAFTGLGLAGSDMLARIPLLILLIGLFILIGAYFKVANLVQYISRSVTTGYITAAALLIITNQIPRTLGLELERRGTSLIDTVGLIASSISTIHWATLIISLSTAALYILLNRKFRTFPNVALCLLFVSAISAFLLDPDGKNGVRHLTSIDATAWVPILPQLNLQDLAALASPALAIALLCVIEGISIGKSLAARTGARLDANQAMYSIGMANIACAFSSGMPASGSLTRSSLNNTSGGNTPLASFYCGLLIAIGAFTLGPLTGHIPQCALAVLVIVIGLSLINKRSIRIVTHATGSDAVVFGGTFTSALFLPLDTAIYIGVALSIILFLKKVARPEMVEYSFNDEGELAEIPDTAKREQPEVSIVHVEGELFFGAADLFRDQMRRICEDPNLKIVVLKMRNAHHMDATGVMALEELVRYMNEKGRYLILSEVKADMMKTLRKSEIIGYIEERNVFCYEPSNPTLSTAKALRRAKEHLGHAEANVSIYVDPVRDKEKQSERS